MSADVLAAILTDVAGVVTALDLGPNVVIRKGAKKEPVVDTPSQLTVCLAPPVLGVVPDKKIYIAFGRIATVWHIQITYVAPNNDDYVTNLSTYTQWRQNIEEAFGPPYSSPLLPTTPGVYDLRIVPGEFLSRDDMDHNIDRFVVYVDVSTAY